MKIAIDKTGVGYGVNTSDVAITDVANIGTLKVGSFLFVHDNGNVIKSDGTITTASTVVPDYGMVYFNDGVSIKCSQPIRLETAKLMPPLPNVAPTVLVGTFDLTLGTITVDKYSGVNMIDNTLPVYDPIRITTIDKFVGVETTQTVFENAIVAKLLKVPYIASATLAAHVVTVTFKEGYNPGMIGLGYLETKTFTVTTPQTYADSLTGVELLAWIDREIAPLDGKRENNLMGNVGLWRKSYPVELGAKYLVWAIAYTMIAGGRPAQNSPSMTNYVYIAIVEGEVAATNEGYKDIFKAFISKVGSDTGAAGADAADN